MKKNFFIPSGLLIVLAFLLLGVPGASSETGDCGNGYEFQPSSGVGCVQIDCSTVPNAHYSYTSRCICGSAGSLYENPEDPNQSCAYPADYEACPGCVYACVHADETCPDAPGLASDDDVDGGSGTNANLDTNDNSNENENINASNANQSTNQNTNTDASNSSLSTSGNLTVNSCTTECQKYLRGKPNASVILTQGEYPNCECQIDVRSGGEVSQTIAVAGPIETTFTFDPSTGALLTRNTVDRREEIEKIRKRLGYRYTEAQIDKLLTPDKVDNWFQGQIKDIRTTTNLLNPQFWWQHVVAVLDHGFNDSSADFVDIHQYGRCGDSMQWLERDLSRQLGLGDNPEEPGQKHEAMLSITGEKYSNFLNHTALLIRPAGITNAEWEDIVKELKNQSGGAESNPGIKPGSLGNIDPRLLDAKVLDPYKKELTTVRQFIKGWSYIRIS